MYDMIIIGTGPAGLEAAITAKIRNKNILLIGTKSLSDKVSKAHLFQNYLGITEISGFELNKKFLNHINQMEIEIIEGKASKVYSMGDYFSVQVDNEFYEGDTVILATGVDYGKMYRGEEEFLGKGVSYCATCDGNLYRDKKIIVIGFSQKEENEANYLKTLSSQICYIPMYKDLKSLDEEIKVIREIPKEIIGDNKVKKLITNVGEYEVDGIFILRNAISPKNLVPGLEVAEEEVIVNRKMETNIKGLYACGDIVGRPYQAIKSAGEGNVAAICAAEYLDEKLSKK